jgi:hypothetical protein
MPATELICDGCGQAATEEHIARRLKRLENMTRYRPVHVRALFLGAVAPESDGEHLYSAENHIGGEGAALLRALGINIDGRGVEATLAEFQRLGYLLTYVLECPVGAGTAPARRAMVETRIPLAMRRIRRSYQPKRLVLFGEELDSFEPGLAGEDLRAEVVRSEGSRAFRLVELAPGSLAARVGTAASASL